MFVSIVIPSFNRQDYITETLDSLIEQSYENWECIVVDDGSMDDTEIIVERYIKKDKRFSFYKRPVQMLKGANSCRNFGFVKAKGKYIKFLDSDDLLTPDALEKQIKLMEKDEVLNVCFSYGRYFNNGTKELEEFWSRNKQFDNYLLGHITNQIRWAISDPLWRKSFFSKPPFKEGLMNSQEWLMHGQALLKLKQEEIVNLKETFTLIRKGEGRISSGNSLRFYKNQTDAAMSMLISLCRSKIYNYKYYLPILKQILGQLYMQFKISFK